MKKRYLCFTLILLFIIVACLASCSKASRPEIQTTEFLDNSNKYKIVDSFKVNGEKYYYIFELGTINCMPMNQNGAPGIYFDGRNTQLSFSLSETNKEISASLVESEIENSIELTTSTYVEGSVSAPLAHFLEAAITVGIEKSVTKGITISDIESYYNSVSKETTFKQSATYTMDPKDPVGYYFYTPLASVKVYEVVVYDPSTQKIEYMFNYNQYGESLPGLYYSPTSFLECNEITIDFDESKLPFLNEPSKTLSTKIEVSVDPAGGNCDTEKLDLQIGSTYGDLPQVTKKGYDFQYWSCDGQKITENDMVISESPIVAVWKLRTSANIPIQQTIEVSSTHKLNPFGFLIPGYNGESSAKPMDIQEYFDFETLKKEGYKMRIVLNYKVKNGPLALWGLKYNFHFHSNGKTIETLSDEIKTSNYISKSLISPLIPLNNVTGSLNFTVSTENVISVYISDLNISIEFVK